MLIMRMASQVQPPLKAKDAWNEKGYKRYKYGLNQSPKNTCNTLEESNLQLIFFYSKICYPNGVYKNCSLLECQKVEKRGEKLRVLQKKLIVSCLPINKNGRSRLKRQCQPKLGSILQGFGVKGTRNCQEGLGHELMLYKSPQIAMVVELCLQQCLWINYIWKSDS